MGLPKEFVVTICIVKEESVLLIKHKKLKQWLPVGGHVDHGEHLEEAMEREIKEECGLEVDIVATRYKEVEYEEVTALPVPMHVQVEKVDGKHEHVDFIYAAKYLSGEERLAESEHDDIRWFSLDEVKNWPEKDMKPDIKFLSKKAVEVVKANAGKE